MAEGGHYVCNHTKNHKNLSDASREAIMADLTKLEDIYREYTGLEMAKYFRFPEGKYSIDAVKSVSALGYKSIFWSFGYEDWDNSKQPSEGYAIQKILQNTHNGAVILLHPTSATNAAIMRTLIREWRAMGYYFGTLDELTSEL
jgi:peptidoglycan-N-acetylmuramic acid deacetylase